MISYTGCFQSQVYKDRFQKYTPDLTKGIKKIRFFSKTSHPLENAPLGYRKLHGAC